MKPVGVELISTHFLFYFPVSVRHVEGKNIYFNFRIYSEKKFTKISKRITRITPKKTTTTTATTKATTAATKLKKQPTV